MRWIAAVACLLAALYFVLQERSAPEVRAPAPTIMAAQPASTPDIATPAPATLPSLPKLTSGFCEPPNEKQSPIKRTATEVQALNRVFSVLHTPAFASAAPLLDAYLAAHTDDLRMSRLRARLRAQIDVQDGFALHTLQGVALAYPPDAISAGDAWNLVGTITDALNDAAQLTGTVRRETLFAIAYRDRSELLAVTCVQAWAIGVYDGSLRVTLDTLQKDRELRHEAMHAQLGPLVHNAPRWWDEGVAQYFEGRGTLRWNEGLALMVRNKTYIPFKSLEGTFSAFEGNEDAALAYDQSHAMVQLLVERQGESVIARAVEFLRSEKKGSLLTALDPELKEADMLAMLERRRPR